MGSNAQKHVVLLRSGNILVVQPTTSEIRGILCPALLIREKIFLRGKERYDAIRAHRSTVREELWECFAEDAKKRLATSFGFAERIFDLLEAKGYTVEMRWATKEDQQKAEHREATVYKPHMDGIRRLEAGGFKFRARQDEALDIILNSDNGRFDCPTGWGKGTMVMLAAKALPKARIAVVVDSCAVLTQRLYPELTLNLPSVGIVGGGRKIKDRRVMCYSADSLHHARGDEDIVFVDEGHMACADKFAGSLGVFEHARMFGFSASWDMRLDNKDLRAEAIFGPIRMRVTYQEAVDAGIIVPIEVIWRSVVMDVNPCADVDNPVEKKRLAYWTNAYRNQLIAEDARSYDADVQVLIPVETLEHALHLKRLLPEYEVVYAPDTVTPQRAVDIRREGLVDAHYEWMTQEKRDSLTKRFSAGKLKKAIATTVWNVGVDFRHLQVLIRGDGGASPIGDTQIPGRNSRHHKLDIKGVGIVHDYEDNFDTGCRQRAAGRESRYALHGWKQHHPNRKARGRLLQELLESKR